MPVSDDGGDRLEDVPGNNIAYLPHKVWDGDTWVDDKTLGILPAGKDPTICPKILGLNHLKNHSIGLLFNGLGYQFSQVEAFRVPLSPD